ncbi:serine acetyltransferase [Chlorobium sp.]|uniref:serine O-acetyltransferase n=1 Tax=Chlorobium sp. TaxID=1095 RepID=UPI0025BB6357|nr:serine acetyltransferase [Chlorobium sp.]MCF8271901.1 serine acetyltransferase [Chlorobium sp.]MCF8291874.1 serine acetyltransferase [Chlorobium sp.]MCF8385990.1 serine acetyltransferase [Chlorobium sp.]
MISPAKAEWSREQPIPGRYEPGKKLLAAIRNYQFCKQKKSPISPILKALAVLRHRFWSAVTGADIPLNSQIDGGLLIPHPNGIVIHPAARIGPNCLIFQQVTIGAGSKPGLPVIEGHVDIGAGAKILGGIQIGAHARIGANAVVLCDIPAGATAAGVPAAILNRSIQLPQHSDDTENLPL